MAELKIKIIAPQVHDGLGGKHREGTIVSLPEDTARILIERKSAVLADSINHDAAVKLANASMGDKRATAQAELSREIMKNHDGLKPDERQRAYYRGDPWGEFSSTSTTQPEQPPISRETEREDIPSEPLPTVSPSSTPTNPSPPATDASTGKATSGKKRRSRR